MVNKPVGDLTLVNTSRYEWVCYALRWTGIYFWVYSHLTPGVPGIDFEITATHTRMKHLVGINEWMILEPIFNLAWKVNFKPINSLLGSALGMNSAWKC